MKDYRIEIKVKNNLILKEIESNGYASIRDFCLKNNLSIPCVYNIISMKKSALSVDGKYRKPALDIATALNTHPELLFNEEQKHFSLTKNSGFVEMNSKEVQELITSTCSETYLIEHASDVINKVFDNLSPREKKIIELRFGLNGEKEHTLKEIGDMFGVSRDRIRQIEQKALIKLRHPSNSKILRDLI